MSVKSPVAFAAGVLLPALSLALALSLVVNIVLFVTRVTPVAPEPATIQPPPVPAAALPEQLPPGGFGTVGQGRSLLSQRVEGIPAGVYKYQLPKGMLPALPATFPLYRDQGVAVDPAPFTAILAFMQVPLNLSDLRLVPEDMTFTTPDNAFSVLVNMRDRTLEISRIERYPQDTGPVPVSPPLPDERMIAIAQSFAKSFGIDVASLGSPTVVKIFRTVEKEKGGTEKVLAPGVEEVRWPLKFADYPVVDSVGRPVSSLSVFVGNRSQNALALNMHVLEPELLSRSDYPTADTAVITGFALAGGMAPVADDEKGKAVTVTYQSAELVYVLPEYDATRPMYIAPALVFSSDIARTCPQKPCTPWTWRTYVPVLDPKKYAWLPAPSPASASSSASGSVVSAKASSAASFPSSAKAASSKAAVSSSAAKAKTGTGSSAAASAPKSAPNSGLKILQ